MELLVQGLYLLGKQRETALTMSDGQSRYLGLNSPPGTGLHAGGQAQLGASRICGEDCFVTSAVVREKWAGKWTGERKGCPARCRGLLGGNKKWLGNAREEEILLDPKARQLCLSQSPLVPLWPCQHEGFCDPPRAVAGNCCLHVHPRQMLPAGLVLPRDTSPGYLG